ncbi:MAG: hypothetical protein ABIQ31_24800 [Ferruginibacter sp.]
MRRKIRSAYPVLTGFITFLLIIRGLGLGIPYVSASININVAKVELCHPGTEYKQATGK